MKNIEKIFVIILFFVGHYISLDYYVSQDTLRYYCGYEIYNFVFLVGYFAFMFKSKNILIELLTALNISYWLIQIYLSISNSAILLRNCNSDSVYHVSKMFSIVASMPFIIAVTTEIILYLGSTNEDFSENNEPFEYDL